jgi:hypothetical protein
MILEQTRPDTIMTTVIGRQIVIAWVEPRFAGKRGEPVAAAVDPSSVSLFDAETQLASCSVTAWRRTGLLMDRFGFFQSAKLVRSTTG